jgi:hypothetical protein
MKKRIVIISLLALIGVLIGIAWITPRNIHLMTLVESMRPGLIPASSYARNLDSGNPELVRESLGILADRKDPIASIRAVELLGSKDDYIWLNAAHYLGRIGNKTSIPYLIKAFRHTSWRSDDERKQLLIKLTGNDFGTDFTKWQEWWLSQNPDFHMDWESTLGSQPRILKKELPNKTDSSNPSSPGR